MKEQEIKEISTGQFLLNLVRNNNTQATFPNVMIALRLLLTLPCSVASGERSFSILKRVKNQFRSTMSQERNVALCLMASNTDILRKLDVQKLSRNLHLLRQENTNFRTYLLVLQLVKSTFCLPFSRFAVVLFCLFLVT